MATRKLDSFQSTDTRFILEVDLRMRRELEKVLG